MCCIDTELGAYNDVTLLQSSCTLDRVQVSAESEEKSEMEGIVQSFASKIQVVLPLGLPSPPRTPSFTVQQYGRDSVTLTVQWQPSQYDGGAPVNYTITVSPSVGTFTTSGTSVRVAGVPYNVIHTVSIVATNCNGSSSAAMVTIRIGKNV